MNIKINKDYLQNLHRVLVLIRGNIKQLYCHKVLFLLSKSISSLIVEKHFDTESLRDEIISCVTPFEETKDLFMSAFKLDQDAHDESEVEKIYLSFIGEMLSLAYQHITSGDVQKAYRLVDAVHSLPEMLVDNEKWNKKRYWQNYVEGIKNDLSQQFINNWRYYFLPRPM